MSISYGGIMICPRCQGSTWDPDGGDCRVCGATGALTTKGKPVDYEDAADFIRDIQHTKPRRFRI
jgi:hypothetical protein